MTTAIQLATLLFVYAVLCAGKVPDKRTDDYECPPDVPVPMCDGDPCTGASCVADIPGAKCSPYLCGGCYRQWKDGDTNVTVACEGITAIEEFAALAAAEHT